MVIDIPPQCALSRRRRRDCFQAHLVLETRPPFRLILCWTILRLTHLNTGNYNEDAGATIVQPILINVPTAWFLPSLGVPELLVVLGIAVLLFGGRKIPEIGKGLGEGIRQFKTSLKGEEKKDEAEKKEQPQT